MSSVELCLKCSPLCVSPYTHTVTNSFVLSSFFFLLTIHGAYLTHQLGVCSPHHESRLNTRQFCLKRCTMDEKMQEKEKKTSRIPRKDENEDRNLRIFHSLRRQFNERERETLFIELIHLLVLFYP